MPNLTPYKKPFLKLLELVIAIAFAIAINVLILDYGAEEETAVNEPGGDLSDMDLSGLALAMAVVFLFLIYFLFWNARVLDAAREAKDRKSRWLNIGLLLLAPSIFTGFYFYNKINEAIINYKAKEFITPVSYREIYHTPNNLTRISGFRSAPDSLLILTNKLKNVKPPTVYRNGKAVPAPGVYREVIENSEELFSLKNGKLKRIATQQTYNQFYEFYFKDWAKCLQAFINMENKQDVYRYDNCTQKHLYKPYLTGFSPDYRHSNINYELGPELFFITQPLYSDSSTDPYFYIGRINDTNAKVYRIELSKDQNLVKEFKNPSSHIQIFATTRHIYLVSRFRILEISI